jgi:K+-sensing histidine kinase KdpD
MNLLTNAIKFTERGSVTIVAKHGEPARPNTVSIVVEDTGIGIAPADLGRIFDEFEQVRPGGRGDSIARGTGLGLAVSRKLARLLGGDVDVDSRIGSGSRFTLWLPIKSRAYRVTTPTAAMPSAEAPGAAESVAKTDVGEQGGDGTEDAVSQERNAGLESGRRP